MPPNTAVGLIWELVDPEGFEQQGDRFGGLILASSRTEAGIQPPTFATSSAGRATSCSVPSPDARQRKER